jgi:hypothetical protein
MLVILLVVWFSLAVLLTAGTLFIQGYLYSEPVGDIFWRGPAAAAALTAFFGFWCYLNYRAAAPNARELPYETFFTSAATEDTTRAVPELWVEKAGTKTHYTRYTVEGIPPRHEYRDAASKRFNHDKGVEAIIVKEGDPKEAHETRFIAQYDAGKYTEEGGKRYMSMDNFGPIYTPQPGRSRLMLLINVVHFAVWFLVVWLLLRFQWPHALGLAALFWLAMTMLIVPQILGQVQEKLKERTTEKSEIRNPKSEMCSLDSSRISDFGFRISDFTVVRSSVRRQDVHNVPILDEIGFSLQPIHAVRFRLFHRADFAEIFVADHFRAHEAFR